MALVEKNHIERCCDWYKIKIWEAGVQYFLSKARIIKFNSIFKFLLNHDLPDQILFIYVHVDDWAEKWEAKEIPLKEKYGDSYISDPPPRVKGEGIFRMIVHETEEQEGLNVIFIIVCRLATRGKAHICKLE